MLRRVGTVLGVIAFAIPHLCMLTSQAAVARTILILNSQPGDYVGAGKRQTYNAASGTFTFRRLQNILFAEFRGAHTWQMLIRPPAGETLAVGLYEDAERATLGSPKKPGLDVANDSRGCNELSGRFLISDLSIDAGGNVTRLAVDFEQHCELGKPALYGSFRYNSGVSIEPRVSIGDATAPKGNAGTSDATIIASLSMPSKSRVTARFRTADSTALGGTDYQAKSGRVVFPPGVTVTPVTVAVIGDRTARGNRMFTITLNSVGTPIGDGVALVKILDPNVPTTVLTMNSQKGAFVGNDPHTGNILRGSVWRITTADTTFNTSRNLHGGVHVGLGLPDAWQLDMAGPDGRALRPARYNNAQVFPFEPPRIAGVSVAGAGRACNTLKGGFFVNQTQYATDGSVEAFSADFEQRCYLFGGGPLLPGTLFGSITVNAIPHQASLTNAVIVGANAVFTVTLNPVGTRSERVRFSTLDGTALAGVDYNSVSTNVTFAAGETQKIVRVPLLMGARTGKQFFGKLSSTKTPLWVRVGSATIE